MKMCGESRVAFYCSKKIQLIEARQLTNENFDEIREWLGGYLTRMDDDWCIMMGEYIGQPVGIGDYIIKHSNVRYVPCNRKEFEDCYKLVEDNV